MGTPRRLTPAQVRSRLAALNRAAGDGLWRVARGRLLKRFVFADFVAAFGFVAEVALLAQAADHHPDWANSYRTVDVALSTHSAGGLTALDFDLASRIEAVRAAGRRAAGSPAAAATPERPRKRGPRRARAARARRRRP